MNKRIMKKFFYLATAFIALVSCSSEEYAGDQNLKEANEHAPIVFGSGVGSITRANKTGSEAATALGNQFIVYAEKNETSGTAPTSGNLVFPNYQVNYAGSASSSTSNTNGWEYVGYTHSANYQSNIQTKEGSNTAVNAYNDAQTIKYWDNAATNYVFTAVSAKTEDIENGRVKIQKNTSGTTKYDKGYTITLAKSGETYPDLSKLYFADRIEKTGSGAYSSPVTFNFRNAQSQVRAGIYETVPGYGVSNVKFYVNNGEIEAKVSETSAFGAMVPNVNTTNFVGTITVTYNDYTVAATENQPKVTATPNGGSSSSDLILGTNMSTLTTSSLMGTTSTVPTWDTADGAYTSVSPQTNNSTDMTLKVDYTLYNSVTGETTNIKGKTVTVPAEYAQWKPNFKYTYLFKITDSDLTPITFDAVVVEAADGTAEYITTVSEPSITTLGYDATNKKFITGQNEYTTGCDIYATILDGSTVIEPTVGTNVNVYSVSTTNATTYPITEASVAESIAHPTSNQITATNINTDATTYFTAAPAKVTTVPSEDGNTVTINAVKLSGVKIAGTYAIEYVKDSSTKVYKVIVVK